MVTVCLRRKRNEVVIDLSVYGEPTVEQAMDEIVRMLDEDEIDGEDAVGPWKVQHNEHRIVFENAHLGACIPREDVERAIAKERKRRKRLLAS